MKDNETVLQAELEYAVKMVRAGYATAEQAARVCGVKLDHLQARLATQPSSGGSRVQPCQTP
jgi:hypothetical protein